MKLSAVSEMSFDEMGDLPPALYKYRDWNNSVHKRILTHRELFLAKPSSFEDPLDCKIPIRYDLLTEEDIFNHFYNDSKKINIAFKENEHHNFAVDWSKRTLIRDKKFVKQKQQQHFNVYDMNVGILCLTANGYNHKMWKSYANNCTGFAVSFSPRLLFPYLGGGGKVIYYETIPIIYPSPKHDYATQLFLQNYSKLNKWSYEEEYRTQIFSPKGLSKLDRTIEVPVDAFIEVLLGVNISDEHEEEIRSVLSINLPGIKIKKILKNECV